MYAPTSDYARPQSIERCAYLGRVSSPKQKLEHQREAVLKFADDNGISIPPEMMFEDKVRRHKQLTEGQNFGRLLELCKAGQVDWILIATFDRWGITDKDDIFIFCKQLRQLDVRLWSVEDEGIVRQYYQVRPGERGLDPLVQAIAPDISWITRPGTDKLPELKNALRGCGKSRD